MLGVHREPAEIEAALLLGPHDGADDPPARFQDRPAAAGELPGDRRRRFLQGAGRRIGRPRLRREREPHERRDRSGVAGERRADRAIAGAHRDITPGAAYLSIHTSCMRP